MSILLGPLNRDLEEGRDSPDEVDSIYASLIAREANCWLCGEPKGYPLVTYFGSAKALILHALCAISLGTVLVADGQVAHNPSSYRSQLQ